MTHQEKLAQILACQGRTGRIVNTLIAIVILLNVASATLETVSSLNIRFGSLFLYFEIFSVAVFSVEYLLRFWAIGVDPKYAGLLGRVRFMCTPMALIDLVAIAPFYLATGMDLREVRALRLMRLTRLLKMGRYSNSMRLIGDVVWGRRYELLSSVSILAIMLIVAATAIYHVEQAAQPAVFSSIPATMWWAVVTLTTVGYGDMLPITEFGKILSAFIATLGVGLFALPASIMGAAFVDHFAAKRRSAQPDCPRCGPVEPTA